ncbi:MAG: exopolysaccharide biosynthesis polyprenyl glycosylphosphotransferase [Pedobacter sp.]|nr:MAG: exopolysaccharide biosynthesis polyprenyl glycosylphosphotransferase [Pedobacter sp.]
MKSRHVFILITLLVIVDALAINSSFAIFYFSGFLKQTDIGGAAQFLVLINLTWLTGAIINGTYTFKNVQKQELLYRKVLLTFLVQVILLSIIVNQLTPTVHFTLRIFLIFVVEIFLLSVIRLATQVFERYYVRMNLFRKNIAIVGNNDLGNRLEKFFLTNPLTVNFSGSYNYQHEEVSANTLQADGVRDSIKYAIENHLDEVYITEFPERGNALDEIVELADQHCVRVKFVTSFMNYQREQRSLKMSNYKLNNYYDGIPILVSRKEPLTRLRNRIVKRCFDIIFSMAVIIFVLSWLFPILMILILIESRGNPIFRQLRSGRDNEPFYCFKFRSMEVNGSSDTKQAERNDPRVTRIGAFMRKTSIDELPQFFNVFFGDMSVVGPRPHMLKHTEEYRQIVDKYMVRQFLKPGITGQAQVNGFRGETKEHAQMLGRVKHDISYMENWTLIKDIKIIIKTITNALGGEENAF